MDTKDLRPKVFAADPHSKDCRKTVGFPIFARYLLKTCRQQTGESLEDYFQKLKSLKHGLQFCSGVCYSAQRGSGERRVH